MSKKMKEITTSDPYKREKLKREYYLKKRKKRSRVIKLVTLLVSVIIFIITIISIASFCNIETVQLSGGKIYTKDEILSAADIKIGDNMYKMNKFKVIEEVEEKLPYIKELKIKRKLFTRLDLIVKEAVPAYKIKYNGNFYICDADFKVLEKSDESVTNETNMPVIYGLNIKNVQVGKTVEFEDEKKLMILEKMWYFFTLKTSENSIDTSKITYINLESSNYYSFLYNNYALIKLADLDELDIKRKFLDKIIEENPKDVPCIIFLGDRKTYVECNEEELLYSTISENEGEVSSEKTGESSFSQTGEITPEND